MNASWVSELEPSLRRRMPDDLDWRQLVGDRDGGWLGCARTAASDEPLTWYRLPESTGETPTPLDPLADRRLPGLDRQVRDALQGGAKLQLLAYKPGRRAVLRVEARDGIRIHKVFHRDRETWLRWSTCAAPEGAAWKSPALLGWDAERRVLTMGHASGVTLHELWRRGRADAAQGAVLRQVLDGVRANPIPDGFPQHTAIDETEVIARQRAEYERAIASPSHRLIELSDSVLADLERLPEAPLVLSHRDFHDKQVLLTTGRPFLIDFDLAAAAPAGLDEGNILGHLELRAHQNAALDRPLPWGGIAARFLEDQEPREDLSVWTASTLVRLAFLYARRHHPLGLIERLTDAAERAHARTGEWKELL